MFNHFKKIFVSLFKYNKRSNTTNQLKLVDEYNPHYKPQYNLSKYNQQNNSEDMLEIVIPGHYCSNATINSKVKDIIRVIGPDRNRQGYWLTQDGKSLNENIILDEYTLLNTASSNGNQFLKGVVVNKKKKKDIMRDFKPIQPKDDYDTDIVENHKEPYQQSIPKHLLPESEQEYYHKKIEQPKVEKKLDPLAETKKLLEKATIEQLNNNYEKKYGTKPYIPEIITIPLKIEIPYHLEKLNQICEIFELDTKTVAQIIFENLRLPEEIILQILNDKLSGRIQIDHRVIETNQQIRDIKLPDKIQNTSANTETVNKGISEVEDYLKTMFSK